jgi:predicted permease
VRHRDVGADENHLDPLRSPVIVVAVAVILATGAGIVYERRGANAPRVAAVILRVMLYVLVPFVSYVNIAHLHVTVGAGVGIALAWAMIGTAGGVAYLIGRRVLRLPDTELGAVICSVVVVNTGYLGLPMAVALLGTRSLGAAVAYDQLVSGPALFIVGFGVGATFGAHAHGGLAARARTFLTRNPPLIGVVAGLVATPALAPAPLPVISHGVVAVLLVLGFFAVGVSLASERREDSAPLLEVPDRRVGLAVILRMAMGPAVLGALSLLVVRVPSAYLLQSAMPTGINSLLVGHAYGLDQRLIATIIVWSTMIALVSGLLLAAF